MKNSNAKILASLIFAICLTSGLNAVQVDPEVLKILQASSGRAPEVDGPKEEEIIRDLLAAQSEEKNLQVDEQTVKAAAIEEEGINNSAGFGDYQVTSHGAAFHRLLNVSYDGKNIELNDKSYWEIHWWDASTVKNWKNYHTIVIAPNTNIFTKWSYPYKFVNLDTHEIVKVDMKLTPVMNDPQVDIYTHWIIDIDYHQRMVRLEDGSIWTIPWSDNEVMHYFDRFNVVMVGTNDGWYKGDYPNILICAKNKMFVRGVVVN